MLKRNLAYLASVALFAISTSAHATLLGSTVNINANAGFDSGAGLCQEASVSGATVVGGGELTGADWTGGCVGKFGADITASTITLVPIEAGNYEYSSFNLQITSGPIITGVNFLGYTPNFFAPGVLDDSNFFPVISFTNNNLSIVWDTLSNDQFNFNGPDNGGNRPFGTAAFEVLTGSGTAVPEPTTMALLLVGLAGAAMVRKRST